MKKIGVITYWSSLDNYGQVLQCYALQNYLKSMGFDAFLIKYQPMYKKTIWEKFQHKIIRNLSFKRIMYFFSEARKEKIRRETIEISKAIELEKKAQKDAEKCQFEKFRNDNISSTSIVYHSIDELRTKAPRADAYICGSDQVWNNPLRKRDTAGWFLDFGKARRISYAASIGRTIEVNEKRALQKHLSKFYKISVREQSALTLCKDLGFTDTEITIDPCLLLKSNKYLPLLSNKADDWTGKLFVYVLNISNDEELHWNEIKKYADNHRLVSKICCSSGYICARELINGIQNSHLTVNDWLSAIKYSKVVVTSSFHGTVFSIIFHTPFVVIPLAGEYAKANDRIVTLLEMVGLNNRILSEDNSINEIMDQSIDWNRVDSLIEISRESSIEFLNDALKGI